MHKNLVICLCIGTKYNDEHVRRLSRMVGRHLTADYDFKCYSDRHIDGIDTILIDDPYRLEPVWYKLQMLSLPQLDEYENKAFFDLDVVIHNNIDWVFDIDAPNLHVIEAKWKTPRETLGLKNTGCNSSVMLWKQASTVYRTAVENIDRHMMYYIGIDRYLWNEKVDFKFIPHHQIYSYREGSSVEDRSPYTMRNHMSVCIYNGDPKPELCLTEEPAKTHWC